MPVYSLVSEFNIYHKILYRVKMLRDCIVNSTLANFTSGLNTSRLLTYFAKFVASCALRNSVFTDVAEPL